MSSAPCLQVVIFHPSGVECHHVQLTRFMKLLAPFVHDVEQLHPTEVVAMTVVPARAELAVYSHSLARIVAELLHKHQFNYSFGDASKVPSINSDALSEVKQIIKALDDADELDGFMDPKAKPETTPMRKHWDQPSLN